MDNKIVETFIPGPAGRLEAKYYKSNKNTSPVALVLQPLYYSLFHHIEDEAAKLMQWEMYFFYSYNI